jgi:hypothetical protein
MVIVRKESHNVEGTRTFGFPNCFFIQLAPHLFISIITLQYGLARLNRKNLNRSKKKIERSAVVCI